VGTARLVGLLATSFDRPDRHKKPQSSVRPLGFYRLLPQLGFDPGGVLVEGSGGTPFGSGPFYYENITFKLTQVFIAGERGTNASSGIDENPRHRART